MSRRTNRRQFIQESAIAGLGFWAAGGVALAREGKAANDKVNIACVGVGGKGSSDVDGASKHGKIIALCDVDSDTLNGKAKQFPEAQKFADYREMLDKLGDKIDAVTVSTPDHTHAPASLMAMKLGKGVYCQKPLTHTVAEAREMRDTAAKMKVATQMGNQGSAENGLREAVEMVQTGVIGPVKEVHVWTNRPVWPQAPKYTARPPAVEVPKYLNWNLWLGVAPERPYAHGEVNPKNPKRGVYHDFNWRGWLDFGTGAIGDMACHTANMAYRALKLGLPTSVVAEAGDVNPETYPSWAQIVFQFAERGADMPAVKFTWYEGHKDGQKVLPPDDLVKIMKATKQGLKDSGSLMIGEKGMLYSPDDYGAAYVLLPSEKFTDYKKPEPTLPRIGGGDDVMKKEWVEAIRGGPAAYSNFDIASHLTESMLLGDVAIRMTGKQLEYDGKIGKITNNAEAEKLIKTEYRTGW
jgi:predicted dehydrogenase